GTQGRDQEGARRGTAPLGEVAWGCGTNAPIGVAHPEEASRRNRLRDALDKIRAHRPLIVAQHGRGPSRSHFFFLEHLRPAALNGTNALGFYARCLKLTIAKEFDTDTNGSSSRALRPAAGAIAAGVERLSRHSPGRDLRRFAAGPSL